MGSKKAAVRRRWWKGKMPTDFLKCKAKIIPGHLNASFPSPAADRLTPSIEAIVLTRITEDLSNQEKLHINQSLETALSGEPILTDNCSLQMGPSAGQYI